MRDLEDLTAVAVSTYASDSFSFYSKWLRVLMMIVYTSIDSSAEIAKCKM